MPKILNRSGVFKLMGNIGYFNGRHDKGMRYTRRGEAVSGR